MSALPDKKALTANLRDPIQPTLQRFISRDPIGLRGGANFYRYASNSPINRVDPLGLDPQIGGLPGRQDYDLREGLAELRRRLKYYQQHRDQCPLKHSPEEYLNALDNPNLELRGTNQLPSNLRALTVNPDLILLNILNDGLGPSEFGDLIGHELTHGMLVDNSASTPGLDTARVINAGTLPESVRSVQTPLNLGQTTENVVSAGRPVVVHPATIFGPVDIVFPVDSI